MKKFKTALIILFAVVIVILIFFLVKNIGNDSKSNRNEKMISEIKYMDNKLTELLNGLNNISLKNYKVSVTKTSTNSNTTGEESTSGGNSEQSSNSNTSSSNTSSNTTNSSSEQYRLKEEGILTNNKEIDWDAIKKEIEILYTLVPAMTLDLYNMNVNQEEILNFNKELDELTVVAKENDKEKTLIKLANLYRYLPVYASNFSDNSEYISLLETKSNVFNSYVFANLDNWDEVVNYTRKATESYSVILNNLDDQGNNYDTNKIYIILNELQNAAQMEDKDVFFIKYKNFLEETEKKSTT